MNYFQAVEKSMKHFFKRKRSINVSSITAFLIAGLFTVISVEAQARPAGETPTNQGSTIQGDTPIKTTLIDAEITQINRKGPELKESVVIGGKYETKGDALERDWNIIIGDKAYVRDSSMSLSLGGQIYTKEITEADTKANSYSKIQRGNMAIGTNSLVGDGINRVNQSIAIGAGDRTRPEGELNESWKDIQRGNGYGAWAKGDQSIALGSNTVAYGDTSIAIGGDDVNEAMKKTTSFITGKDKEGKDVVASKTLGVVFKELTGHTLEEGFSEKKKSNYKPYYPTAANTMAIAIGTQAQAEDMSTAMGLRARATQLASVALGAGSTARLQNSVAIGVGSEAGEEIIENNETKLRATGTSEIEETINGVTYTWAGGKGVSEGDIVSFGRIGQERQLKNVAPGKVSATSTDAINGSQLYAVAKNSGV